MITEKQVQDTLKIALKKKKESNKASRTFDKLAGEYFSINDFSAIYVNHDELVDPIVYGDGNLTWEQLLKAVDEFKKESQE